MQLVRSKINRTLRFMILSWLCIFQVSCKTTSNKNESSLDNLGTSFPSTIPELSIGGAHVVLTKEGAVRVIRSQAPTNDSQINELINYGVTDVIIFKNETGHEVKDEIAGLTKAGIEENRITHIPMGYHDFDGFNEPCRNTIDALKTIAKMKNQKNRILQFHCTVGEDRTGYLAGLVKLLDSNEDIAAVFENEMCKNGYSSGNPKKPKKVTNSIDRDLTPIYLKLGYLIDTKKITWSNLDADEICSDETSMSKSFEIRGKKYSTTQFKCN